MIKTEKQLFNWAFWYFYLRMHSLIKCVMSYVCFDQGTCYKLEKSAAAAKSLQSCPTLCDPIDRSPSFNLFITEIQLSERWSEYP